MNVLVLRALGLGDLLTAVPALRAVRRARPDARVRLAAPAALGELVRAAGLVDEVVDARPLEPLPARVHHADLAVNLHGRGPQSVEVLRATAPDRLVSYGVPGAPAWRPDEHEVLRWCRLLEAAGMPADPRAIDLPAPRLAPPVRGAVVVHPGAGQPSRRWPAERWAEVAGRLDRAGETVVVTGGPAEDALAEQVATDAGLPPERLLAGRTDLPALAALVAAARLVVAPDTGVAHLATAYRTPSVTLFGPTPPALWGPPSDRPQHRVLWAGRTGDNFAPDPDEGLLRLTAAQVVAAAETLLRRAA